MVKLLPMKKLPCGRPLGHDAKQGVQLLNRLLKKLAAFVEKKGLNRSQAREKILETIVKEARHFRAQDLLERLQKRYPEVGKATLYRNLPVLVESGLIQEGPMGPHGNALYELSEDRHHDHIVCMDCEQIFEFHNDFIEQKQTLISKKMGFTLRDHRHVIYASCDYLNGNDLRK